MGKPIKGRIEINSAWRSESEYQSVLVRALPQNACLAQSIVNVALQLMSEVRLGYCSFPIDLFLVDAVQIKEPCEGSRPRFYLGD